MSQEGYEAFKKILDSKGMAFKNRIKSHSFTLNIFTGNASELNEGLAIIENPDVGVKLMSQQHKQEGLQAHREINRLFHNYLAAAKTLIDHTRVFIEDHYSDSVVESRYKDKILNEFAHDFLARFVQDLRNFMLHNGLPHNEMTISYVKGVPSVESSINLDTEKLKEWSRWTKPSKEFLNQQSKKLSLSDLIEPYSEKVVGLHNWLLNELNSYHEKDLKELHELQLALDRLDKNVT
ncbi:hypothetical protein [Psychromonas sp. Urea-02u-13]|uniref:hypothetical protein n=1 Tax=Psychromonas sp. Urea-02u-13 TaxID=2058326 RepID=UPI000C33B1C4|nr:hypothetical protein [Psychromonas sp. Urea-02u-13]PKG40831.1 hypothetical protein CXF74_01445 [Psychromonas sp. Urea-02u-13]